MNTLYSTQEIQVERVPIKWAPISFNPDNAIHTLRSKSLCGSGTDLRYAKQGHAYIRRLFCERWDCRSCRAYKVRRWIAKAEVHPDLWAGEIDIAGSEAFTKKVSRRGGNYFSVPRQGKNSILSTVPIEGFRRVASSQEREALFHEWLEPTVEEWGKNKRVRHSRGWGRSQPDEPASQEDDDVMNNQEKDEAMAQPGQPKMTRLVFIESPKDVIEVLQDLGSSVKGDVEDLVAPPSEDRSRSATATLNLSARAMKLLDLLATGEKDPDGRLHLAWTPKSNDRIQPVRFEP